MNGSTRNILFYQHRSGAPGNGSLRAGSRCMVAVIVALSIVITPWPGWGQVFRGYYSNGAIEFKAQQDNNRRIIKGYYPSGGLHYVAVFKHGRLNGLTREYYENGRIKAEVEYADSERDGESRFYYPSGTLMGKIEYHHDQETGVSRFYDENGMLIGTLGHKKALRERIEKERLDKAIEKAAEK
jgi:hypothetical protein